MKPVRPWVGLAVLTIGLFEILDATARLKAGTTISHWRSVAFATLGVVDTMTHRRLPIGCRVDCRLTVGRRERHSRDRVRPARRQSAADQWPAT
jgi:hypothetical protein